MRIRRMLVTPDLLMRMGSQSGLFAVIGNQLPPDAELRQATIDPLTGCIQLFVESSQFDEVPEGHIPPEHPAPIIQRGDNLGPWRETQE